MTDREKCYKIMDSICVSEAIISLADLPDLPCVGNALDDMEELIEANGSETSMEELRDIAQDAVHELLEEEGFPF